jgi:serine/threonine-protein kinase HipA
VLGVQRFDRALHSSGRWWLRLPSWHEAKMAMAVVGKTRHYRFEDIERRHFDAMAAHCGWGPVAAPIVERLLGRVDGAIEAVARRLPAGCPAQVADAIFAGLRRSADRLAAGP